LFAFAAFTVMFSAFVMPHKVRVPDAHSLSREIVIQWLEDKYETGWLVKMKRIILKNGKDVRVKRGHPWVWDNEVAAVLDGKGADHETEAVLLPGEVADVESGRKEYLGRAFVNPQSKIVARIYSPSKEGADIGFFRRRIREAMERRATHFDLGRESFRMVFAEADFLPGLIIDRFVGWPFETGSEDRLPITRDAPSAESAAPAATGDPLSSQVPLAPQASHTAQASLAFEDMERTYGPPSVYFSIQFLTYAMDARREMILDALPECAGVYEKSTAMARTMEGLDLREGVLRGKAGRIVIFENGCPFVVNFDHSQKTGHFFDQARNHAVVGELVRGLVRERYDGDDAVTALDCFCYTGGFSIPMAQAGARVTACDSSAEALAALKTNALLNGVEHSIETTEADVFDLLTQHLKEKRRYTVVVLDPPAFAKNHATKSAALRGYKELNLKAMKLLEPDGILVTCSCSEAVDEWLFRKIANDAAQDTNHRLHLIEFRHQSPDHPILTGYDESQYLKCGIYRVMK
jgi:23S rRNA (cytosine1962-C5)-methyltransferase